MGGLIASLVVGGIAGWLAGQIMKGKGQGIVSALSVVSSAAGCSACSAPISARVSSAR
jgi:uncharacterized membrane protein YeaQ/YmgE (transglycosylase-associated protein family)